MDPYFSAIVSNLWEIEAIEAIKAVSTAPAADTATAAGTLTYQCAVICALLSPPLQPLMLFWELSGSQGSP